MIFAGSNFKLTCIITLDMETETVGPIKVSVRWSGPLELGNSTVQQSSKDSLHYSSELQFGSVSSTHTGNYTCQAEVSATNSSHLISSSPASDSIIIDIGKCTHFPDLYSM